MFLKRSNVAFRMFLSAVLLTLTYCIPVRAQKINLPQRGLCAHRGAMDTHPENTIPALQEAVMLGAQMIEFDIQFSKDSVLVIMHDETVDRTTNGKGKVSELTWAQLLGLDAGIKKAPRFAGTRIPSFREVLAMMPRNVWLNCHLKGGAAVGAAAARMLADQGRLDQAFLTCGETAAASARTAVPQVLICNGENSYRRDGPRYTAATLAMNAAFIQFYPPQPGEPRAELIRQLKEQGVRVNFYHARQPEEVPALFAAGVDFILVNDLGRFQDAARKAGVEPLRPQF